jgi:hypothetical protein
MSRLLLVFCVLLICFGVLGCGPPIPKDAASDYILSPRGTEGMFGEFQADRDRYIAKYQGKVFEARGTVSLVDQQKNLVLLSIYGFHANYPCHFAKIPRLESGQAVIIKGNVHFGLGLAPPIYVKNGDAFAPLINCIMVEE